MGRRLAAVVFTDVVGFTASAQADEAATLARLREQADIVRRLLPQFGGREVKSTGDGSLLEFESALKATECAVEVQRKLNERNRIQPSTPILLRIGIHVGDVEEAEGDILGDAVNVASRVVPLAEPGGVCLSAHAFAHVEHKVPYSLEKLSPRRLKGVREGLGIYKVVLPWTSEALAPVERSSLPRIAVLPLVNISPDPENEYFADGLTEELTTVLSQIQGLRVISRTSVNQYRGTTKPVSQIGAELGADAVLEGSVRKAGNQLRIAVQLIDPRTDEHRWAQTYDRKLENIFAIQADVAESTAGALKVELLMSDQEALQEHPTSNLTAYEFYLRGIRAVRAADLADEHLDEDAERFFERAIEEDPHFSAAYAALANHLLGVMGGSRAAKDVINRVREVTAKALELNPRSSAAHTARGNLALQVDLDWTRAEQEFQQGIALNPSSSDARFWYAFLLSALQRSYEAVRQYRAAIELDPLWFVPQFNLVYFQACTADLNTAVSMGEKLHKDWPDHPYASITLAWIYILAGREEEARMLEPTGELPFRVQRISRPILRAYFGQPDDLLATLADVEAGRMKEYVSRSDLAIMRSILGENELALDLLEEDYREGDKALWNNYQDPRLDGVRSNPRFIAMLRAMNLPTTLKRPFYELRARPPRPRD